MADVLSTNTTQKPQPITPQRPKTERSKSDGLPPVTAIARRASQIVHRRGSGPKPADVEKSEKTEKRSSFIERTKSAVKKVMERRGSKQDGKAELKAKGKAELF